jgi:hypothetical protein
MIDEERDKQIGETHDAVIAIKTVLLGVPDSDDKGLVGQVNDVCESHSKLKTVVFWLIGILIGSGIIAGTAVGVARAAGG